MASVTRLAPLTHDIGDLEYVFPKTPTADNCLIASFIGTNEESSTI